MTETDARRRYRQIETYRHLEEAVTALAWKHADDWRLFEIGEMFAIGRIK